MTALWTINYQGRSAEEIAERLNGNGMARGVHISTTAAEMDGGDQKSEALDLLSKVVIELEHINCAEEPLQFRGTAAERGRKEPPPVFRACLGKCTGERGGNTPIDSPPRCCATSGGSQLVRACC
jgi:hypothetical protein